MNNFTPNSSFTDHRTTADESRDAVQGWNYETSVVRIEAIIQQIESGELELADIFDQFAAAVEELRQCESFLTQQQRQMDLLIETLVDSPDAP
ncbi:exodeoxyribonuclease VII small subunit [Leptolyngbya sp. AN02str]|uniref:exodeoxyribonuclease VII small subunit n=1 Tax=Leptolyngbya sp. AN02str TaxID=3423363 RepID=UPI003D315D70